MNKIIGRAFGSSHSSEDLIMSNEEQIDLFVQAREYLLESVQEKVELFMTDIWDPLSKYIIIRETNNIIKKELKERFPDLSEIYFPRCKFKIFDDEKIIEAGVQQYFNPQPALNFLGVTEVGPDVYDMYYRTSFDPRFDVLFVARYGHDSTCHFTGSHSAKAEYYLGEKTPLSVAYSMALDDGLVE